MIATHQVIQKHRVPHLYWIPLGSGSIIDTWRVCSRCSGRTACDLRDYQQLLPAHRAKDLAVAEILRLTTPWLAQEIAARGRQGQAWQANAPGKAAGLDPRVRSASARLTQLGQEDPRVQSLQARLAHWAALRPEDREQLLDEIDGLTAANEATELAVRFVAGISQRFKAEVDFGLSFTVFLMCLLGGLFLTGMVFSEPWVWYLLAMVPLAAVVAAVFFHRQYKRHLQRRFFKSRFLPKMRNQRIALDRVIAVLESIDPEDENQDENLIKLARALPILRQMTKGEGQ
jgi:hypothetical protein